MAQPTRVNGASRVLLLFALAACTATPSAVLELDSSARWLTVKAPPDPSLTVQVGAQAPRVRLAKRDGAARVELAYASGPFVLGAGTVHGSQVDYHDGAVTLRLEATQTGVKEHLLLPAFVADSLLLEWTLELAPELTARREANGSVTLSSQQRPVYQLPTPVLRDAMGMVSSAGLSFELLDGRVRLRATGLASRAYPLDLDPTIVTLTADFAAGGNLEGDVDLSSDQLTRARPTSDLGAFAAVNALPSGRSQHCSVVSNGFLYVLGGDGSAGALTTVDFAPITGATLGAWAATTPLPTARSQHACVAYDGFIYVLGGQGSALLDEVLVARIGSTGALGAWVSTTALPSARRGHSAVALHGRLFALGGTTAGAGLLASVDVATFNADGTIGAWSAANPFINARTGHASVGFKDFIYVTGGTTAVGDSAQVQVVRVGPNGALGTWRTVTGLPSTRRQHAAFAAGSALFVTGGSVGATNYSTTVIAVINADGTLGAWGPSALLPSSRHGLSANAYNGVVFIVGGGSTAPLDEVHAASITSTGALGSALGAWVADPAFTSRSYHTSVAANGYLYAIAGQKNAVGVTGEVDAARVLGDGTLVPSVPATPLPSPRFIHASAQANGYVYVLGGTFMGAVFNDVLYAHLNLDGTLGAWAATSSFAVPRYALAAVASNGYMYVIAGATDSMTVRSDVQVAAINADGSLGPFTVTSSLPSGRYYFAAVANRGFLYVVAGVGANFTGELAEVLVARQGSNGSLTAWTPTTPMPATRFQHEALASNGSLYVFGGYRGGFLNEVYQAGFANDGTLGAWAATTPMPVSIYLPRAVASDGIVYVVGGAGGAESLIVTNVLLAQAAGFRSRSTRTRS